MSIYTDRARAVLPGGVNSPVRAWNGVGGEPVPVVAARGAHVIDAEGNEFLDLVASWGPAILGHAHPDVVAAVQAAAARGLSFGATTEAEVDLAEAIRARYAPAQRVRLVSTGTEATMTAIRLARGATGREVFIKFAGCYHGHSDALLVAAGSGLATAGSPDSAGVTRGAAADTMVLPYGDAAALTAAFEAHGERIAAVITEAAPCNMGVVTPPPGFNRLISTLCQAHGAVMILDEVLTGFRAGPAGYWGVERDQDAARGLEPWVPDLVTFGKVIGGGMPVAAIGGRTELMEQLAPLGPVYQAGTLSGNPVAVAAGLATLEALTDAVHAHVAHVAQATLTGVSAALSDRGIVHSIGRAGTIFSVFLGLERPPVTFAQACEQDSAQFARMFHALRADGISLAPSAYEAWFLTAAHTESDVSHIVDSVSRWAAREAAGAGR